MSDESEVSSEITDSTPAVEEASSQEASSGAETQESPPEKTQEEKPAPFHEHPRFKELIEQNRAAKEESAQRAEALQTLQRELQALRQQVTPKKEEPKDQFLADLEKVNPAYAKSLQSVYDRAAKAEQIEARLQQYEQQQFAEKAISHFNGLLESSKITDPMDKKLYERAIKAEVYDREAQGQKLGLKDLDKIFSEFHSEYSKAMEERNRKLTASYVQDKKTDKAPKGSTGGAAASPATKKIAAGDIAGQAKWLADQIRTMKKTI